MNKPININYKVIFQHDPNYLLESNLKNLTTEKCKNRHVRYVIP